MGEIDMLRMFTAVLLIFCATPAAAGESVSIDVEMEAQRVGPHSYYVQGRAGAATEHKGFISNAGFVVTGKGVVVIDSLGSPALAQRLRQVIAGVTDEPVVKVIVTHYHADHIYGLQVFESEGAEILAPRGAHDYLASEAAERRLAERRRSLAPWVNEETRLVAPDRIVDGAESFTVGDVKFRLEYLGKAHSNGDLAVLVEPDLVLYSGDLIFEGRIPFVGDADTRRWLETLAELEHKGVAALVPGHGPAARDPGSAITLTRRYLQRLREVMGAAVEEMEEFSTAFESADWSEFRSLPAYEQAHRSNAYNVYLSMEAESMSDEQGM